MKRRASEAASSGDAAKRRAVEEEMCDDDEMDQSQRPDFRPDIEETSVGVIEHISLKNFMCHNRLDINLGNNVNFIVGRNGSGKSAVVTALVVGLGGKASATSRGNTVKTFVKTGKQSADVEIRLRNRGTDAYKPESYGDSIIVQRRFTLDGASQYKLKSKEGRVVSLKREELSRILDQFNIQVDNPVSVLNQDTSRNFLNSKSPNDKYKFFLKATQLEQIKTDYTMADKQKEITHNIIEQKQQSLPMLQKEVLSWERKYKALTALEDLKIKIKRLNEEIAWALVIQKEKGMGPLQKELNREISRLPRFVQKAEESKAKVDTLNTKSRELGVSLKACGEEVKQLQPQHADAKNELNEQKKLTRNAQMESRRLEDEVRRLSNERESIRSRIQELQNSAQHDYEAERKQREEKIRSLQEQIESLRAKENTTDHQLDQFRNAVTKYKNDEYKLGQDVQTLHHKTDKLNRNLQMLKASQGNRLKRFGAYIPELIQHIEEYSRLGRFHRKPIGPLGACFQLTEQKWALAVECCLRGLMNAFCCHDYNDEKLLEQIMSNVCPPNYKPTIIVSSFKDSVYDVSRFRSRSREYPAVLDVIQSDLPMVANTFIDQRNIECVILIEDGRVARNVMDPDRHPGPPPKSREAFTLTGDQVYCHPSLRYYSSMQENAKFLTSSVEENVATLTREIQENTQLLTQYQQEKTRLAAEIKKNMTEERRTETQLMKVRQSNTKLIMELNELKNIEDPAPVDVTMLEEEVTMLEGHLATQGQQLEEKNAVHTQQQERLKEVTAKYKDIEAKMKAATDDIDSLKEKVGELQDELDVSKGHKKHYDQKLKEKEKEISDLRTKIEKYQQDIESDIEKAKQIQPERIETRRTPQNLESEINQINKQVKTEEKKRGDPEEVSRKFKEKKTTYFQIKKEVAQAQMFCEQLETMVGRRLRQFSDFRSSMARRAKQFFIMHLSNRHYKGSVKFDHQKETLDLAVQPIQNSETEGGRDIRSLSGGERSFSTVCFILALWEAIESPFRCLDEFDVFMDMVNRRISMDMMMQAAKTQLARQFIFLSPQDMSRLGISGGRVRIFEMPEPDRGQEVLPFRPVGREDEDDD